MPLKPVTDQNILNQLQGGNAAPGGLLKPVTDPNTISLLNEGGEKGFLGRVGEDIAGRRMELADTFESFSKGETGLPSLLLQTVGKGIAGPALDIIGETVVSGAKAITPDPLEENIVSGVQSIMQSVGGTDLGQEALEAIQKGSEAYEVFKKDNPVEAKNIESVINVGLLFAPVKGNPKASPSLAGKGGAALRRKAIRQEQKKRIFDIEKLVRPKETPTELIEQVPRTKEVGSGLFKRSTVELSPQEKIMATEVQRIPKVGSSNTIQGNYNIIADHNVNLAKRLEKRIASIPKTRDTARVVNQIPQRVDDAINDLIQNNPTVVGDAALAAKARLVGNKAIEILADNPKTPLGVLQSRRSLDNWLLQNRPKVFDQSENTLSAAGRAIRDVMNSSVQLSVPAVGVKDSLRRQSTLYGALENIAPKAASEANNVVARLWQNTGQVIGIRNRLVQDMAVLFGVGGLGAASMFAPAITKGAIGLIAVGGTGKLLVSPNTKRGLSKMLKAVDRAVHSSKDPSMIKQLRADRAALVEIIKNSEINKDSAESNTQ